MKLSLNHLILAIGSVCLTANSIQAQTYRMGGTVPFAFHANDRDFASGKYIVEKASSSPALVIEDRATGKSVTLSIRHPSEHSTGPARITFHRYGNEYFLAEVWNSEHTGVKLAMTSREKEIRNASGMSLMAEVTVDLARNPAAL